MRTRRKGELKELASGKWRITRNEIRLTVFYSATYIRGIGVPDDPLQHMRERIDMCRRLAKSINDQEAARILREMADQGEIDLKRLLEERDQNQPKSEAR